MMTNRSRLRALVCSGAAMMILSTCSKPASSPPLDISDILIQKESAAPEPFGVDICIDATPSMEGFAVEPTSAYRNFLDDLEGSFVSGVKNVSDLRFFKFGERLKQVPRQEFRNARSGSFYHEPGIFKDTNIDLVFRTADIPVEAAAANNNTGALSINATARRVIVVVTDLLQRDQDINIVIQQVKSGCLSRADCSVGLLAIPSAFDGTVYDVRVPNYHYKSTNDPATFHPFYLLMFGPEEALMRFADVLSARKYIDLDHLLIIGPRIVRSFSASVVRDPSVQGLTSRTTSGSPLDSAFNLRKEYDEGKVIARLKVTREPTTFDFNPSRIIVRGFRETNGKREPAQGEFSVQSTAKVADALEIHATIHPPGQKGDYRYIVEATVGDVNGFALPRWISDFSSPNPMPEHDPAKTLNLDRFVEQMISASLLNEHHQPKLARFRVLVHRLK